VRPVGLKLIVAYKFLKGSGELGVALILFALSAAGHDLLHQLALEVRRHLVGPFGLHLSKLLDYLAEPSHLHVLMLALVLDGLLSGFQGWALFAGYRWGRWLVVIFTGALIPLELVELARHPTAGRVAILVLNLTVVLYLVFRVRRQSASAPPALDGRA
jgi:uncharacterized membrane protein (DUF2068 family)